MTEVALLSEKLHRFGAVGAGVIPDHLSTLRFVEARVESATATTTAATPAKESPGGSSADAVKKSAAPKPAGAPQALAPASAAKAYRPPDPARAKSVADGAALTREEILDILAETVRVQGIVQQEVSVLARKLAKDKDKGQKKIRKPPPSFAEGYKKIQELGLPQEPLEDYSLTETKFQTLLMDYEKDEEVMTAAQQLLHPVSKGDPDRARGISMDKIIEIHQFMVVEMQKVLQEFLQLPQDTRRSFTGKGCETTAELLVSIAVEQQIGVRCEDVEHAVIMYEEPLQSHADFTSCTEKLALMMQTLIGATQPRVEQDTFMKILRHMGDSSKKAKTFAKNGSILWPAADRPCFSHSQLVRPPSPFVKRIMTSSTRTFEEYQRDKREREWKEKVKKQKERMNNAERVKKATEWKTIGNDKFKSGNYWEAREYYREAIIYVEDLVDARRKERNDLLMPLYTNLAQVHLKVDERNEAEDVCTKALAIADIPKNIIGNALKAKALFRRGVARRGIEKLDDAKEDFIAAHKLQPENEDVARELASIREELANQVKKARAVMGGFLNREADEREQREAKKQAQAEARRIADERRKDRRARAEQKQQMQEAFQKLAEGKMLYEEREKEMGPVREKEREKEKTLELERDLRKIIDESKGTAPTTDIEKFKEKRLEEAKDQSKELDQKKKVLDKVKKEEQWDVDDQWKGEREEHRKQIESRRQNGEFEPGPKPLWDSKEVARWCEQRLRDMLVATFVEGPDLEPDLARAVVGKAVAGTGYVVKALVTDVLKLTGDAAVMRLNPYKPPLHYYDYFVKLDWEVAVDRRGHRSYRSGEELISHAANTDDGRKAPPSVAEHAILAGTFKIKEFCSEDEPTEGNLWQLATKVKKQCDRVPELSDQAELMRDRLREKVQRLLARWAEEFREHWK